MFERSVKSLFCLAWLTMMFSSAVPARAQDPAIVKTAVDLLETYNRSTVNVTATVRLEVESSVPFPTNLLGIREASGVGTVMDPTGLVVVPNQLFDEGVNKHGFNMVGMGGVKIDIKPRVTNGAIVLSDGREIPATVLLKDLELGVTFLRPTNPEDAEKFADCPRLADIEQGTPGLLDQVITVGRVVTKCDNQPLVEIGRVFVVLEKPDIQYGTKSVALGCPLFTADRKIVGIATSSGGFAASVASLLKAAEQIPETDE